MKSWLFILCALMVGCGTPIDEVTKVGSLISKAHFRDAITGKCVALTTDNLPRSNVFMTLAADSECGPR